MLNIYFSVGWGMDEKKEININREKYFFSIKKLNNFWVFSLKRFTHQTIQSYISYQIYKIIQQKNDSNLIFMKLESFFKDRIFNVFSFVKYRNHMKLFFFYLADIRKIKTSQPINPF